MCVWTQSKGSMLVHLVSQLSLSSSLWPEHLAACAVWTVSRIHSLGKKTRRPFLGDWSVKETFTYLSACPVAGCTRSLLCLLKKMTQGDLVTLPRWTVPTERNSTPARLQAPPIRTSMQTERHATNVLACQNSPSPLCERQQHC